MPTPATQAQLLARTILLRAIGPHASELQLADPALYEKIMADLRYFTSHLADDASELLRSVLDTLCEALATGPSSAASACRQTSRAIQDAVESYCVDPIDPYVEIFNHILALTQGTYESHATWTGGGARFELVRLGQRPKTAPADFPIAADTDPTGGAESEPLVRLLLPVPLVDLTTLAAVPYVLAHECVCHAGQGNGEVRNDSVFTEGWMDFVAELVHDEALSTLSCLLREQHRRAAQDLIRLRCEQRSGVPHWAERHHGRACASELFALYTKLGGDTPPDQRFYHLSLHLNASPSPNSTKDLFVGAIWRALARESTRILLVRTLRSWEEQQTPVEQLVDDVLRIR